MLSDTVGLSRTKVGWGKAHGNGLGGLAQGCSGSGGGGAHGNGPSVSLPKGAAAQAGAVLTAAAQAGVFLKGARALASDVGGLRG